MKITALESVYALEFFIKCDSRPTRGAYRWDPAYPLVSTGARNAHEGGTADCTWTRWQRLTRDLMRLGLNAAQLRGTCIELGNPIARRGLIANYMIEKW